ncbi:MAG: hypothetical protein AAGB24_13085 [Bacteroidota bacterium]
MKIEKTVVSLTLVLGLFFNAFHTSAQKVDLSKESIIVESDLHASYIKDELTAIEKSRSELLEQLKAGDKKAELALKELDAEKEDLNKSISGLTDFKERFRDVRPPRPNPCPRPKNCFELVGNTFYLLSGEKLRSLKISVYTENGQLLGKNEAPLKTLVKNKPYSGTMVKLKDYSGPVTLKVAKTGAAGKTTTYSVPAYLKK